MLDATQALTVIAELDPDRVDALVAALDLIEAGATGAAFDKSGLPDTHFTRFVVIQDNQLSPLLVWESNHDGITEPYLRACLAAQPGLETVLGYCRDFPSGGRADVEGVVAWLKARSRHAAAFYCGYRGVPKHRVDNDGKVHQAIRDVLDAPNARTTLMRAKRDDIRAEIAARVARAHPELDTSPQGDDAWRWRITLALVIVIAIPLVVLLAIPAAIWWWQLRRHEEADGPTQPAQQPVTDVNDFHLQEDFYAQNQLTHLVDIKPGLFRLFTAWVVLTAIDVLANCVYVDGELGGITSIHFARWVILPDWREAADIPPGQQRRHRLLFFSNYDGSWESYLGEFVDRAAGGLTAVWSHTVGFPYTCGLIHDGAHDEENFKQWTRNHQVRKYVWWSGVPTSTVQNVRDDLAIRGVLNDAMNEEEAKAWLLKL